MPEPELAALVVTYGRNDELGDCLGALAGRCRVLVVDSSSDEGVRALAEAHGCSYEDALDNAGFAAGVNRGLRRLSDADLVVVVNPDAILDPSSLDKLVAAAAPGVALVAPRLRSPDGTDQRVLWPLPSPWRAWRQALLGGDGGGGPHFAAGAVMLLRQDAVADVGGFDERFFLYAEETDWQRRALVRGWRIVLCDEAVAVHAGAGTSPDSGRRLALFHAGTETYIRKWYGPSGWQLYRVAHLVREGIRILTGRAQDGSRARLRLYARGPRRAAGFDA